jgi:predicted amidohydrolase
LKLIYNNFLLSTTKGGRNDASSAALKLNPNCEALFIESTLTSRCFENTCAVIFANAAGPTDQWLGLSRVVLPFVGPVKTMGAEEGFIIAELDMSVLDLAEDNYKVRQDLSSEGWHYSYRHDLLAAGEDKATGR